MYQRKAWMFEGWFGIRSIAMVQANGPSVFPRTLLACSLIYANCATSRYYLLSTYHSIGFITLPTLSYKQTCYQIGKC